FFQAEEGIRDWSVTGVQTCALPIYRRGCRRRAVHSGVRDRGREPAMSGREASESYYGRPILKEPVWKPQIPFYFFTGGLSGASRSEERRVGKECRCGRSRYR